MKITIRSTIVTILFALISALLVSCSGSGSGGDDDQAKVKYQAELEDGRAECITRLKYRDDNGNLHTLYEIDELPWSKIIYVNDGAHIYLYAEVECDWLSIYLYINNKLIERKNSYSFRTIEGNLRIDEEGNATFEEI